jgi:hypothetical protein
MIASKPTPAELRSKAIFYWEHAQTVRTAIERTYWMRISRYWLQLADGGQAAGLSNDDPLNNEIADLVQRIATDLYIKRNSEGPHFGTVIGPNSSELAT